MKEQIRDSFMNVDPTSGVNYCRDTPVQLRDCVRTCGVGCQHQMFKKKLMVRDNNLLRLLMANILSCLFRIFTFCFLFFFFFCKRMMTRRLIWYCSLLIFQHYFIPKLLAAEDKRNVVLPNSFLKLNALSTTLLSLLRQQKLF